MTITSYGVLNKKDIADIIAKKHGVNTSTIAFRYINSHEIRVSFDVDTHSDFGVVDTLTYNNAELLEISNNFLKSKGFNILKFEVISDHTPGSPYEPLDYGSTIFTGFKFYFETTDPA